VANYETQQQKNTLRQNTVTCHMSYLPTYKPFFLNPTQSSGSDQPILICRLFWEAQSTSSSGSPEITCTYGPWKLSSCYEQAWNPNVFWRNRQCDRKVLYLTTLSFAKII